jgi:hypothetical protein
MTFKRLLAYTAAGFAMLALVTGAWLAGGHWGAESPLGEFTPHSAISSRASSRTLTTRSRRSQRASVACRRS